jgi:hypothetical protein
MPAEALDESCVFGPDAPQPWEDVDELELATLSWVHWFNEHCLHSHGGDISPADLEGSFHAAQEAAPTGVGNQEPGSLHQRPCGSRTTFRHHR